MRAVLAGLALASLVAGPTVAADQTPPAVYSPSKDISTPKVISKTRPRYTDTAKAAGIQGTMTVECVVLPDGAVGDARVTKSLEPGLDEQAIKTVRQWRFEPGRKDGKAVAVRVSVEFTFTLRSEGLADLPFLFPAPAESAGRARRALGEVYAVGGDVSAPVVVKEVKPQYGDAAKKDKVQGIVTLDCVVLPDGSVGDIQVARSLDGRLDQEAVKALKQWTFKPGMKDGKPVAVLVSIDMRFTLR